MKVTSPSRTETVLSFLRCPLSPPKAVEAMLNDFQSNRPYRHLVLDNLFPPDVLYSLLGELPPPSSPKWVNERRDQMVKSNLRSAVDLGTESYNFSSFLHSAGFLYFLSEITGIKSLLPDPYLTGAGFHVIPEGGKFDVHVDRNTDHHSGLERRLAMMIYLNDSWKDEYGGQLELWNETGTQREKVIEPLFNRTVIFEIGDKNFHAVRPVTEASGFIRRSFAVYFHTVKAGIVQHNTIFAPPIYQGRTPVLRRVMNDVMPPVLFRALKGLKGVAAKNGGQSDASKY